MTVVTYDALTGVALMVDPMHHLSCFDGIFMQYHLILDLTIHIPSQLADSSMVLKFDLIRAP